MLSVTNNSIRSATTIANALRFNPTLGTCGLFSKRAFQNFSEFDDSFVRVWRDTIDSKPTGVTVVALNRPTSLNALTVDVGKAFGEAMARVAADVVPTTPKENGSVAEHTRAVVLTGMGTAFSAGGDMAFLTERSIDNPHHNAIAMREFYRVYLDPIRTLPVPVIAAINGHAIGAGLCLALATDMRIASLSAKLGVTFVGLGIHPGMAATHFLPSLVGNQIAARLLLTGDLVSGTEAKRLNLILDAVEPDKVLGESLAIARRIANQSSVAVQTCVRTLRNKQDQSLESSLWREADAQAQCYAAGDIKEGILAIKEKRSPVFNK